jgi:hypothetical protein
VDFDFDAANVAIAGLAALLGWYTGRTAERRAYRLGASSFAADWYRDLRTWASEAIDVLSEAIEAAAGNDASDPGLPAVFTAGCPRLSALIDRGRFFLPNYAPDDFGRQKPPAFRGLRHPAVDYLVAGYNVMKHGDVPQAFKSQRDALVEIKRQFVSHVQEILDPREQNRTIAEIIKSTRADPSEKKTALERLGQPSTRDAAAPP